MVGREEEAACSTASRQRRGTKSRKGRGGVKTKPVTDGIGRIPRVSCKEGGIESTLGGRTIRSDELEFSKLWWNARVPYVWACS